MPRSAELEAWFFVPMARIAIALLPFRVVHRYVETRRRRTPSGVSQEAIARAVARVPGANCLTQVVAAAVLSARHGHASTLRLGVARSEGKLLAHAWLESEGRVIMGEPEPGTFVALG